MGIRTDYREAANFLTLKINHSVKIISEDQIFLGRGAGGGGGHLIRPSIRLDYLLLFPNVS